jgi:DUF4097 and DUF4098 domain-containing protein YvlB
VKEPEEQMRRTRLVSGVTMALAVFGGSALYAQESDEAWLANCRGQGSQGRYCEVRPVNMPAGAVLRVDSRPNGGVRLTGSDQAAIAGSARIQASADSEAEARELAAAVRIETTGGTIRTEGPKSGDGRSWSVSFVLSVPRVINLEVDAVNGPIAIEGVNGQMRVTTVNGPLTLRDVGGDVQAKTTNGPLDIVLGGSSWEGAGLEARTNNGPLRVQMPEIYSAQIDVGTVNGRLAVDVPVTVQGDALTGRSRTLTGVIGGGGPMIRAHTTNGPVAIGKR